MMKQFTFSEIWNDSVATEDREPKERDYCWASELGKPLIDRYLTMKGVKPTNPPNIRSRRKFFAGNVWEFIAGMVLNQLGIIQEGQERVEVEDYALKVTGKLDFKIGGIPNYSKARDNIRSFNFDRAMTDRFLKAVNNFEATFGNEEIAGLIYEMKSCSEYVVEKIDNGGNIIWHDLQLWHYLKGMNMPDGRLAYISKNDALMAERQIMLDDNHLSGKYSADLKILKGYLDANQRPPVEDLIVWEGKFQKNFLIEYSQYLTLLYGFKRPDEYADSVSSKIQSWNRVLVRMRDIKNGKKTKAGKDMVLTDSNKEAIEAMRSQGHVPEKLCLQIRQS